MSDDQIAEESTTIADELDFVRKRVCNSEDGSLDCAYWMGRMDGMEMVIKLCLDV